MRRPYIDPDVVGFATVVGFAMLVYGEDFGLAGLLLILAGWIFVSWLHDWILVASRAAAARNRGDS